MFKLCSNRGDAWQNYTLRTVQWDRKNLRYCWGAAHNYKEHGGRVLLTKPGVDTKGGDEIVSRMGVSSEVDFIATPEMDMQAEVLDRQEKIGRINALLVDEAQFLQPRQVDQLFGLAVGHAIPVLAFGLRTDFRTHGFPGSLRLMEIAHVLREAVTMCGHGDGCEHKAHLNARKVGGLYVAEGAQVVIDGGADVAYTSLCSQHYIENVGPVEAPLQQAPSLPIS